MQTVQISGKLWSKCKRSTFWAGISGPSRSRKTALVEGAILLSSSSYTIDRFCTTTLPTSSQFAAKLLLSSSKGSIRRKSTILENEDNPPNLPHCLFQSFRPPRQNTAPLPLPPPTRRALNRQSDRQATPTLQCRSLDPRNWLQRRQGLEIQVPRPGGGTERGGSQAEGCRGAG